MSVTIKKIKKSTKSLEPDDIIKIIDVQRTANLSEPVVQSIREDRLDRCIALLRDNQSEIAQALNADFGNRHKAVSLMSDIVSPINTLKHARKNVGKWMKPARRSTSFPFNLMGASSRVHYQPLGCVGNIVPWNFPFNMAFSPLASIFAAGNRCVLKPSEYTPASSNLMQELVIRYFDETELAVVLGGSKVGAAFAKMPFDHLLFTGSTSIAPNIIKAAAGNMTPLTLELGGKSPVIVSDTADLDLAAARIMSGKGMNAGQVCLSPDYVFVSRDNYDALIERMVSTASALYPTIKDNDDYTSIINQRHFTRLQNYLEDAREKGAKIVEINPANEDFSQQAFRKIPLTLILNPTDDMLVMQEEIFGPLLPVKTYESVQEAIGFINAAQRPLALYYFGKDKEQEKRVLSQTTSGGVCVNDVMWHFGQDDLPFGGVGKSGYGAYHGYDGFRNFSHAKAVYRQTSNDKIPAMLRPPYTEKLIGALKFLTK